MTEVPDDGPSELGLAAEDTADEYGAEAEDAADEYGVGAEDEDLFEDDEEEELVLGPGGFLAGDLVFYPQIGHCWVGEVIEDASTGLELLELIPEESAEGNRVLVPVGQVESRGLRLSGDPEGKIPEILGSDFEPTISDASERLDLITAQEREGTVESLALALKRLHLRHEMKTATREEQRRRARIRKWLVRDHMAEHDATVGQGQAAITRNLSKIMRAVREREKEAAREKRRQDRARRKAESAAKRLKKKKKRAGYMANPIAGS